MLGSLTSFTRRRAAGSQTPGRTLTDSERQLVPLGFEAVAEALVSGRSPIGACATVGRALAEDGACLGEALSGLRRTFAALGGAAPDFEAVEAMSVAWSETTMDFLNDVSCEDPLTGLASLPHLRSRVDELYREAERSGGSVREDRAVVVVELVDGRGRGEPASPSPIPVPGGAAPGGAVLGGATPGDAAGPSFRRALRLAAVADALRTVFSGEETIARLAGHRVGVLVRRTVDLGETVGLVRPLLEDLDLSVDTRMWIEGLPAHADQGMKLLSELAR